VFVPGRRDEYNPELEKAWRVADFLELGELMCEDALHRNESCGGHFREEYQTEEGEALRDDETLCTWPPGNGAAKTPGPNCTRKRWSTRRFR
jgi:succinate dehydrogenase/fumarate reductase flavoprotein subunit